MPLGPVLIAAGPIAEDLPMKVQRTYILEVKLQIYSWVYLQ